MSSLTLLAIVHAAMLTGGENSYADACKITAETGKPMIVLVGAKWCPACKTMKESVIPQIVRRGLFRRCVYTAVDLDEQKKLGRKLTSGGPIPQLIMYRRTRDGWRRRRLIGGQSVNTVEKFIDDGIKANEEEKSAAPSKDKKPDEDRQASASRPAVDHAS